MVAVLLDIEETFPTILQPGLYKLPN